jgi:hypothetical protein
MLTLVAFIACVMVLVAVVYLGFVLLYEVALRLIGRLPARTQDRLLRTTHRQHPVR